MPKAKKNVNNGIFYGDMGIRLPVANIPVCSLQPAYAIPPHPCGALTLVRLSP